MEKTKIKNNTAQIKAFVEAHAPKVEELKYSVGEDELIVKVYPVLPFIQRATMIREIVDGVFMDGQDSVNTYAPEYLEFLQKYTVIKYFTDFKLQPKLEDMWLVLNYTPIYNDVVNKVGVDEINKIFNAANEAIDTYRKYLTTKTDINSFMNKIGKAMSDLEGKFSQEDVKAIMSKIKGTSKDISLQDIVGSLFNKTEKVD